MRTFLVFLITLLLITSTWSINVVIYHGAGCPHCAITIEEINKIKDAMGINLTLKEIYHNEENRKEFFRVCDEYGVPVKHRGVPTLQTGKTLVIGEMKKETMIKLFRAVEEGKAPEGWYFSNEILDAIEKGKGKKEHEKEGNLTWAMIISAALADSINPCTLAILTVLTAAILTNRGRKQALGMGILFVVIVYISYMLMGIGILKAINLANLTATLYYIIGGLAFYLAFKEFKLFLVPEAEKCPGITSPIGKQLNKFLRGEISVIGVVLLALLCSFILLPCSSGPYLVILTYISTSLSFQSFMYLAVYNFIFVLPMLAVVGMIFLGEEALSKIEKKQTEYTKHIHLFSSIIMFILGMLIINEIYKLDIWAITAAILLILGITFTGFKYINNKKNRQD